MDLLIHNGADIVSYIVYLIDCNMKLQNQIQDYTKLIGRTNITLNKVTKLQMNGTKRSIYIGPEY